MFLKKSRLWVLLGLAAVFMCACGDSGPDRHIDPVVPEAVESGKAAQVYVKNARIIADKAGADGLGNFNLDSSEVFSFTSIDGDFSLDIPKGYGHYVLFSQDGTVTDSHGNKSAAFPMLAPKGSANITPITTLVVLCPGLKDKIGADYDADIADPAGVSWDLIQLAKTVEAVLVVLADKNRPIVNDTKGQIAVMKKLAVAFADDAVDLSDDDDILAAAESAVQISLSDIAITEDPDIRDNAVSIASVIANGIGDILGAIPNFGVISEEMVLADAEQAVGNIMVTLGGTTLAFSPEPENLIVPFPNDVVWASVPEPRTGLVTLDPATASDTPTAALYTAVNAMELRGLSPNAPIGIPLTSAIELDAGSLQDNVRMVNLNTLLGVLYTVLGLGDPMAAASPDAIQSGVVKALANLDETTLAGIQMTLNSQPYMGMICETDIKVQQDANYITIFPLGPLDADTKYLVYIKDDLVDTNGIKVRAPELYNPLKSEESLIKEPDDPSEEPEEPSEKTMKLEQLRLSYAPLYAFLRALGVDKEDTLEIFTFTTAHKTLSLRDFGVIGAALEADDLSLLANLSREGLPYDQITQEYAAFDNAINYQIQGTPAVIPGAFISFDITTLANETPDTENVPYTILNREDYTDTVVIFQHGFGRQKEDASLFANAVDFPVIAMDLRLHGGRAAGDNSGAGYLSIDMGTNRVNLYQSLFDMTLLLKSLKNGQFDLDGDGEVYVPNAAPPDPDDIPARVCFVGQSMGAITGSMFSAFNSDLDKVVLNVGGANLASIVDGATNAEIAGILSLEKYNTQYYITMALLQTLIDPADPAYLANPKFNAKDFQNETLVQTAYMDTLVPNISNEILARVIGYSQSINITDFSVPIGSDADWYHFGGQFGMDDNWIKHGFLLDPEMRGYAGYEEAQGHFNQDYLYGAYNAARNQIAEFFGN